jgi:serine/threonine protein kinase
LPERLPYDEALRAASVRLKVSDPEIKEGHVEMIEVPTAKGVVENPWGVEGGFAVVYKFRTRSGQFRALRCFRVPMEPDMQFRYEQIGPYFHKYVSDITAAFRYHDDGILVNEQGKATVYPLIEMDWVDGVHLVDWVDEFCQRDDRNGLQKLGEQWAALLRTLHNASIAHGDLSGPNIMVRPNGQLMLIDYDGVYIPLFAGKRPVLLGQPDYQHPQMAARKFDEHMDAFSALVIYVALLALALRPELWQRYAEHEQGKLLDSNLLFKQKDFLESQQSPLFSELASMGDQRFQMLVQELKRACTLSVEDVRFPFDLLDNHFLLEKLQEAIAANDDEQILQLWTPTLAQLQDAQPLFGRVQQARQCIAALARWRATQEDCTVAQIISDYNSILDDCSNVKPAEHQLLAEARTFQQCYRADDDEALLIAADTLLGLAATMGDVTIAFTAQEQQRIDLARQRQQDRQQIAEALQSQSIATIAAVYPIYQRMRSVLTAEACEVIELTYAFAQAYDRDEPQALLAAFDALERSPYHLKFLPTEQQRIAQVRREKAALDRLRAAFQSKQLTAIAAAYDPLLDRSKALNSEEREYLVLARAFSEASQTQDDDMLIKAYERLQSSPYRDKPLLTAQEEQQVQQARRRQDCVTTFFTALHSKQPRKIVAVYYDPAMQPLLVTSTRITSFQHEVAQLALTFLQSIKQHDMDALLRVYETLQQPLYKGALTFTREEQRLFQQVQSYQAALLAFTHTLNAGKAGPIVSAYKKLPPELQQQLTGEQQRQVKSASLQLNQTLQSALQLGELRQISAFIKKNQERKRYRYWLVVQWHWPPDELIRDAIIIYSAYNAVPVFKEMQDVNQPFAHVRRTVHEESRHIELNPDSIRDCPFLYLRMCIIVYNDVEDPLTRKHYLSEGITGQVHIA